MLSHLCLVFAMLLVCSLVHQFINLACVTHFDFDKPRIVLRRRVHKLWAIFEALVDFDNCTRDRGVYIRSSLDRFDTSKRVARFKFIPYGWQIDKDDIAKSTLSKVGDSTNSNISLDLDVFMGYKGQKLKIYQKI